MVPAVAIANTAFFMSEASLFFRNYNGQSGQGFPATDICERANVKFNVDERLWESSLRNRRLAISVVAQSLTGAAVADAI
jgi:hypothetical protein